MIGPGTVHISGPVAPRAAWENEPDDAYDICCAGAAMKGVAYCTCWEPVFDLEQAELDLTSQPTQRAKCCHDCAYRPDSPERQEGSGREKDVIGLAHTEGAEFWCHQGVRRPVVYRHPDGREIPGDPDDYRPPETKNADGVACIWKADGTAGERCAGWDAYRKAAATEASL